MVFNYKILHFLNDAFQLHYGLFRAHWKRVVLKMFETRRMIEMCRLKNVVIFIQTKRN